MRQRAGALVLDTREPAEFAAAHLTAAMNIGLGGRSATWAGTVLDPQRPIVIIADPGREQESEMRLGRIGSTTSSATWRTVCTASRRDRS